MGLLAGFRTSGESERPGFAWFFGRDAMWTHLQSILRRFPLDAHGTRFLKKFSARQQDPARDFAERSLINWFNDYEFPWASADATLLYVLGHADYWRATGDTAFLKRTGIRY